MTRRFVPPREILDLFRTEELAETYGRQAIISWMESLPLRYGDYVLVPENSRTGKWFRRGCIHPDFNKAANKGAPR